MARLDTRRYMTARGLPGQLVVNMGPKNLAVSGSEYTDGLSLEHSLAGAAPILSNMAIDGGLIVTSILGNSGSNTQSDNYVTASVMTAGSAYSP